MTASTSPEVRLPGRIVKKAIDSLTPYARNARTHSEEQVRELAASIKEFGWTTPVLITGAGEIIAGHGRVLAAQKLGLPKVPCIVADHLSEAQRRAYVLADNQLALNAGWDQDLLAEELRALQAEDFDLELTGFDDRELAEMLMPDLDGGEDGKPAKAKAPAAPPPPAIPVTAVGDIWQLGRHRVMCGDSTSEAQMQRLLDGNVPDLICTDPPYCSGGGSGNRQVERLSRHTGSAKADRQRHIVHPWLYPPARRCLRQLRRAVSLRLHRLAHVGASV